VVGKARCQTFVGGCLCFSHRVRRSQTDPMKADAASAAGLCKKAARSACHLEHPEVASGCLVLGQKDDWGAGGRQLDCTETNSLAGQAAQTFDGDRFALPGNSFKPQALSIALRAHSPWLLEQKRASFRIKARPVPSLQDGKINEGPALGDWLDQMPARPGGLSMVLGASVDCVAKKVPGPDSGDCLDLVQQCQRRTGDKLARADAGCKVCTSTAKDWVVTNAACDRNPAAPACSGRIPVHDACRRQKKGPLQG